MSHTFNPLTVRHDFPIFRNHPDLIYFDNAATSQRPERVLREISDFDQKQSASVHRGLYELSSHATRRYEAVRDKVAALIGAENGSTIAFTKGTTESINIVANSFRKRLKPGDNIVISGMEHHANLIPWQMICKEMGASLRVIPVTKEGELSLDRLQTLMDHKTRLLAVTHVSNVLGTINPVDEIILEAHLKQVPILVDAAQSAGHLAIHVKKLGADFLAFSAHKMFGPFGTGVLYANPVWAPSLHPLNFGGGIIQHVDFDQTEFLEYPRNLEAGTANVSGVLGLGAAVDYIRTLDAESVIHHEHFLATVFKEKALQEGFIRVMGNPRRHAGIVAFNVNGVHPHDVASYLASRSIAVRAGHHCAEPLLQYMNEAASVRVSFSVYNTADELDRTIEALKEVKKFWA
ncbi:MAG: cysteine desulfurase [Bacteroidetes bacterium]|nr:cysteine desulfurase [Bacteroidota bacterium]